MKLKRFDLNLLLALDALLSERSVSRAAKRLHLSQPAVSTILARLRVVFNDPLLLRGYGEMLPTPLARELAGPVGQLLADVNRLVERDATFNPATADLTFTLGASDYIQYILLPQLVPELKREAPRIQLAMRPIAPGQILKQMETGEIDLCVTSIFQTMPPLHSVPLYTERAVFVVRHDHPQIRKRATLDQFCGIEHVLVFPNRIAKRTDDALAELGRARRFGVTLPDFFMVPEVVTTSDMIGMLPERLARHYAERLVIFTPPLKLEKFTLAAFWHERTQHAPVHNWLRGKIVRLMGEKARRKRK